jgi:hypothetical protein
MNVSMKTQFKYPPVALLASLALLLLHTPVQAGPGSALSFNGTANQYVSASVPAMASNYTICAWTYLRGGGDFYTTRLGLLTGTNCGNSIEVLIRSATTNAADPQYLELGRCGHFSGRIPCHQRDVFGHQRSGQAGGRK